MKQLSTASITLHQQKATKVRKELPSLPKIKSWVQKTLEYNKFNSDIDVTIRFVDAPESAKLNFKYRKKHGATNILTFPLSPVNLSLNKSKLLIKTLSARCTSAHKKGAANKNSQHLSLKTIAPCFPLSGDLVICMPLVIKEASNLNLTATEHLAHLIIHGILHLLGYTHKQKKYAIIMEKQESAILKQLGYVDPYL